MAGCFAVKPPVDLRAGAIHPAIPCQNLPPQDFQVGNSSGSETLPREDADFDFRLIEPAAVSGCVVNGEAVPDLAADLLAEQVVSDLRQWIFKLSITR